MRLSGLMVLGLLAVPGLARASSWTSGDVYPLDPGGSVADAWIGVWSGESVVVVGSEKGVRIVDPSGVFATSPLPIRSLRAHDLNGDGALELLACGPQGVHVLHGTITEFSEPVQLLSTPCKELEIFEGSHTPGLLVHTNEGVSTFLPKGDARVERSIPLDGAIVGIAANGSSIAVLTTNAWIEVGPQGRHETPIQGTPVGIVADGDGFAVLLGGDVPVLQTDRHTILPSAPQSLTAAPGVGGTELFVGFEDQKLGLGIGSESLVLVPSPASTEVLVGGDINHDGCVDLFLSSRDGAEASLMMGRCGAEAQTLPEEPLADPEGETVKEAQPLTSQKQGESVMELGSEWQAVDAQVGRALHLQLNDSENQWVFFEQRGAPPSLELSSNGKLTYLPEPKDAGIWRVNIRVMSGDEERWTGIILRVEEPGGGPVVPIRDALPAFESRRSEDRRHSFFGFRECMMGVGVSAGVSQNRQQDWTSIGLPDLVVAGSPAALMACNGGSEHWRWVLGADSAPFFFHIAPGGRMPHLLAGTLGMEYHAPGFRIGPILNAGLITFGGGLRVQVLPFKTRQGDRHGVEFRSIAFPTGLGFEAMLAYVFDFGRF